MFDHKHFFLRKAYLRGGVGAHALYDEQGSPSAVKKVEAQNVRGKLKY